MARSRPRKNSLCLCGGAAVIPFLPVLLLFGIKIPFPTGERGAINCRDASPSRSTSLGHRQTLRPKGIFTSREARTLQMPSRALTTTGAIDQSRRSANTTHGFTLDAQRLHRKKTRSRSRRPIHDAFVQQRFPRRGGYEHGKMGCGCCRSVTLRVEMTFLNPPQAGTRDRDHLSQRRKGWRQGRIGKPVRPPPADACHPVEIRDLVPPSCTKMQVFLEGGAGPIRMYVCTLNPDLKRLLVPWRQVDVLSNLERSQGSTWTSGFTNR